MWGILCIIFTFSSGLKCVDQKNYIHKEFNNRKGDNEWVDEVCTLGVRVT